MSIISTKSTNPQRDIYESNQYSNITYFPLEKP